MGMTTEDQAKMIYVAIGWLVVKAVKDRPRKPVFCKGNRVDYYKCPKCGNHVIDKYCPSCGARIKWRKK